jgi:uncharacterized protein (TIGR03382 family)
VLTVSLTRDAVVGPWSFSIVAAGGGLTHIASALLTVVPPADFDLTVGPSSVKVAQNGSASVSIAVSPRNGFTGPISLEVKGLPAGVTASLNPGNNPTLTLSASGAATPGTYAASVVASGGGASRTVSLSIEVVAEAAHAGGCASGGATGFGPALLALLLVGSSRRRRFWGHGTQA